MVDGDTAYVRSVRGPAGRRHREATANPVGAVHASGKRVAVRAEPGIDADSVSRVSEALKSKYEKRWPGPTASMLLEPTLPTTLRLRLRAESWGFFVKNSVGESRAGLGQATARVALRGSTRAPPWTQPLRAVTEIPRLRARGASL